MNRLSDEKLVISACSKDSAARAELVKRHYKNVFMKCFGILGNTHDAEDAAQEVMLTAFTKINKLRDADKFAGWLSAITRNACINSLRKQVRLKKVLEENVQSTEKPANEYHELHYAIGKLTADVRQPLVMYYLEKKDVKTIALDLEMSASAVYTKLKTATIQLHELLVRQGVKK